MTIVGICGPIASGKSTFAETLAAIDPEHSIHLETSQIIVELANVFNTALQGHIAELNEGNNLLALSNALITALLPSLNAMAGHEIPLEAVAIQSEDIGLHPDWYEKLFTYLRQVQQLPGIAAEVITPENKNNFRILLQWIGGYFLYKLDNRLLWYEELIRRIEHAGPDIQLAILTAPRQPAEAEFVQAQGGKVIKIVRPGLESDTSDVTERMVAAIIPDSLITNDGSLQDFQKLATEVRKDLLNGSLKPEYFAHS